MHGCCHVLATVNSATAIWRCRCVLHILISFPLDTPSVERLPAHMGVLFLTFVGFPRCFLHWFIFPPAVCWDSFLLTSLLAPVVFCLWNSHSHLGFQLHFTDDQRENIFLFCSWWPVGHLLLRNVYLSRHLFHICGDSLGPFLLPIYLFGYWVPKFLITLDQTEIDCKLSKVTYTASYSILSGGKAS